MSELVDLTWGLHPPLVDLRPWITIEGQSLSFKLTWDTLQKSMSPTHACVWI